MKRTAISALLATQWAITESALEQIRAIAEREHEFAGNLEALEAKLGRPLGETARASIRDGVATIPVEGPLMAKANLFAQISGATSYQMIALAITEAVENPEVKSIVLMIDSPGGAVPGVSELAEHIRSVRGKKPIVAHVHGTAASAAYWIASAADRIVASDVAMIGSIGAVMGLRIAKEREGEKTYEFVSAQSPLKRVDPGTNEGKAEFQRLVDDTAQVFIETVASNRSVSQEKVIESFGKGAVFLAADALERGMIDSIGTFESVFSSLTKEVSTMDYADLTAATLAEKRPDLVKAIGDQAVVAAGVDIEKVKAEALAAGAQVERDRCAAIDAVGAGIAGSETIIAAVKADPKGDAATAQTKIIEALRAGTLTTAAAAPQADAAAAALKGIQNTEAALTPPASAAGKEGDAAEQSVEQQLIASAKAAGIPV